MRTPTPMELLEVWERGDGASAAARGVLLLATADDGTGDSALARTVGQCDAELLRLRAALFGPVLEATARCPACGAIAAAAVRCDDLLMPSPDATPAATFDYDAPALGIRAALRLPTSADLLALEGSGDLGAARATLLARCVRGAQHDGASCAVGDLPAAAQAEIAQAIAAHDPQADVQLGFHCPGCGTAWQPVFDIAAYLWQELHAWALRLLRDVDVLAQCYHWREADILALSPRRRQAYLELCAP